MTSVCACVCGACAGAATAAGLHAEATKREGTVTARRAALALAEEAHRAAAARAAADTAGAQERGSAGAELDAVRREVGTAHPFPALISPVCV